MPAAISSDEAPSGASAPNRGSIARTAGLLSLCFLLFQVVSGVLLALHYRPTIDGAHPSVMRIMEEVPFGWFVRGVHVWSSHLLISSAIIWFCSKYFLRTYRSSTYINWSSTIWMVLLLAGFGYTGMLLPWDQVGFYSTQIGAGIAASVPLVGGWLSAFLLGGSAAPDDATIARMFSLHAVALPVLGVLLASYRLYAPRFHQGSPSDRNAGMEMADHVAAVEFHRWTLALIAAGMTLLTLAILLPTLPGLPADPAGPAPEGIRPAWYFLPIFMAIRSLPGTIGGIETDAILATFFVVVLGALFALPRLDRGTGGILVRVGGIIAVFYALGSIIAAWVR